MRKIILVLLLTLVFGISLQAQTSQKITVQIEQQKTLPKSNLKIKFVSLIEDSRCPLGTQCIQAGRAKIQIEVGKNSGASKTFEISTDPKARNISFANYTIEFVDLNPRPANNIRINRLGYKATFNIHKSGK